MGVTVADPQYGAKHQARRRAWVALIDQCGPVLCGKEGCGRLVYNDPALNFDGAPWHLGHGVAHHHGGNGEDATPWHQTCNTEDGYLISQAEPLSAYEW